MPRTRPAPCRWLQHLRGGGLGHGLPLILLPFILLPFILLPFILLWLILMPFALLPFISRAPAPVILSRLLTHLLLRGEGYYLALLLRLRFCLTGRGRRQRFGYKTTLGYNDIVRRLPGLLGLRCSNGAGPINRAMRVLSVGESSGCVSLRVGSGCLLLRIGSALLRMGPHWGSSCWLLRSSCCFSLRESSGCGLLRVGSSCWLPCSSGCFSPIG